MENYPDVPRLSVVEAHALHKKNKYVMAHSIQDVMVQLKLTDSKATFFKLRRRYLYTIQQKNTAGRNGKMAQWISNAEQEEFYSYLPAVMPAATSTAAVMPAATVSAAISVTDIPAATMPVPTASAIPVPTASAAIASAVIPAAATATARGPGRSKAPFSSSLHRSTVEKRVDAIIPPLQAIADAENTSLIQLLLIVLVKLCRRIGLPSLAKLLYTVFISMSDIKGSTMSMEKSAYMMVSQELGRDRYTELRSTLMSEGFEPQPWYKVNAHCEAITPERIPVILHQDEGICGYRFSFKEVCKYVVNRAFLAADIDSDIPDRIFIAGKDGTDGSGQHYRRATAHVAVKGNIFII